MHISYTAKAFEKFTFQPRPRFRDAYNEIANKGSGAHVGKVVALLEAGMSQRELARQWINGRTGEAYSRRHIQIVLEVASLIATKPRPIRKCGELLSQIKAAQGGDRGNAATGPRRPIGETRSSAARDAPGSTITDPDDP